MYTRSTRSSPCGARNPLGVRISCSCSPSDSVTSSVHNELIDTFWNCRQCFARASGQWNVVGVLGWRKRGGLLTPVCRSYGERKRRAGTAYTYGVVLKNMYIGATVTILVRTNSPGAKEMDTE